MKVTQVTVGIQRVINLGNYENVRYECSLTATVDEDEVEVSQEVYQKLLAQCKSNVLAEIERIESMRKK